MSTAWYELKRAVHILVGQEPPRERLLRCYTSHLATLRSKDLPTEIRNEFSSLVTQLNPGQERSIENVRRAIEAISNENVMSMIHSIVDMYDAVTRYQPLQGGCGNCSQGRSNEHRNTPD